jgi:hypothetical protein
MGPSMNEISTATESSARAVRRSWSGTAAMTAWRMIENDGIVKRPARAHTASSGR